MGLIVIGFLLAPFVALRFVLFHRPACSRKNRMRAKATSRLDILWRRIAGESNPYFLSPRRAYHRGIASRILSRRRWAGIFVGSARSTLSTADSASSGRAWPNRSSAARSRIALFFSGILANPNAQKKSARLASVSTPPARYGATGDRGGTLRRSATILCLGLDS